VKSRRLHVEMLRSQKFFDAARGPEARRVLNTGHARPMVINVPVRHDLQAPQEAAMPSPRKAPASNPAETEMSSRKKTAGPKASPAKAAGAKEMQVAKRSTKAKPKS
jgi:hypothetical protein